ncbi:hypothetical protein PpBr36_03613 [Pyricularia pennisetigena]|uniref:hypothetical protein n=1 Tax=Pyricularia pennisetigena TaxID=1578925 RepID=UPI00114F3BA3|nr:hypothetical protein PpBr36_03613 [Pyricularia pennisetigena]TLS30463.1 hypothetical protein PpBr36_03613 [Pyricularia pennisetigena]
MSQQDADADAPAPIGNAPNVQDFAVSSASGNATNPSRSSSPATSHKIPTQPLSAPALPTEPARVHYDLHINTNEADFVRKASGPARSDTQLSYSPMTIRRRDRAMTFRNVEDFEDYELRTGWHPGAEPGVDPRKPNGGHDSMPNLEHPCQITVVDFSQSHMEQHTLDNASLVRFLDKPQPKWSKCRWINVNGLSWDVISALGKHKNLHRLAIEDIMNTRNRTKADWFANHAFIILSLQKLVHIEDSESESSDDDTDRDASDTSSSGSKRKLPQRIRSWWSSKATKSDEKISSIKSMENGLGLGDPELKKQQTGFSQKSEPNTLRTLQRYHGANDVRSDFMEKFSVLAERKLAVMAEQVSLFMTNDNTIISFFEFSAQQVEEPILVRLSTPDTVLRQSCDASMIGQALLDAIIDLAIPLTGIYADVIGDLELDVLTRPNITHTKKLYITVGELNKIVSFVNPIISLINSLRDHKSELLHEFAATDLQNPSTGVVITPLTHTYLGDVLDHAVLIVESLQQLRTQADGMIGLIFNTISAYQNESLKQLTLMTIIFLPLTFITGYFGMNFEPFEVLKYDVQYFWKIAIPAAFGTCLFVMRDIIWESLTSLKHKHLVIRLKKDKNQRRRRARRKAKAA